MTALEHDSCGGNGSNARPTVTDSHASYERVLEATLLRA